MKKNRKYVLGVDFGSLSARSALFDVEDGTYIGSFESPYAHGIIEDIHPVSGEALPPASALQMPSDFMDSMIKSVRGVIRETQIQNGDIIAMSVDATSCTLLSLDREHRPLCEYDIFKSSRHSYAKMWKQHTAAEEAKEISNKLGKIGIRYGGKVMSEWGIPKILETLREEPSVYDMTYRFMEMGDWIIWHLTGVESMSYCSAGLKFLWTPEDGYPSQDFFAQIDEGLRYVEEKLVPTENILPLDTCAGFITEEASRLTGLPAGIPVAPMRIDGHSSCVAVGGHKPGTMTMILGTSMGLLMQDKEYHPFPGINGACFGSMVPGLYGYETGLSGCGDIFQWFIDRCVPSYVEKAAAAHNTGVFDFLTEEMKKQKPGESGLIALDWWNGNRSVLADEQLTGLILGLTLQTKPSEILRALFEATGFGARTVVEAFEKNRVPVREIVAVGGIAEKNPVYVQMLADILGKEIIVPNVKQACAFGTALFAAVAAGTARGGYDSVEDAIQNMGKHDGRRYLPDEENHVLYNSLFAQYTALHDAFGRGEMTVMKDMLSIKQNVR